MGGDGGRRAQAAKGIPGHGMTEQRREQLRPTQEKSGQAQVGVVDGFGQTRTQTDRATEKDPQMSEAAERYRFVMGQRRETGPLQVIAEAQQNSRCVRQRAQPHREE